MQALVINDRKEIIFTVEVDAGVKSVEIAGAITADGAPVNRKTYKLSRSKANLERTQRMDVDSLIRREYKGSVFFVALAVGE